VLADAELVRRGEAEDVRRDADAERVQPRGGVAEEGRDGRVLRLRVVAGEAHERDVAVRREAHVVELDLVEAGLRRGDGDVDVVAPGGARVRVEPGEAAARLPHAAVRMPDRELRVRDSRDRVLERDDAADQVDPGPVRLARGRAGVEVRPGGAVGARDPRRAADERDVAALVLQVDLDGVQAVALQREVLVELARERHQRPGDVHAADLLGQRRPEGAHRRGGPHRGERDGRVPAAAGDEPHEAEDRDRAERREDPERGQAPPADLSPADLAALAAKLGVVDVGDGSHEDRGW